MEIFLIVSLVVTICLVAFWRKEKKLCVKQLPVKYQMPEQEQMQYKEAAEQCKKDNSPIFQEPFSLRLLKGAEIVNKEKFYLVQSASKGCEKDVL